MIRLLLTIMVIIYVGVFFIYPNVNFDTTKPQITFLSGKVGNDYVVNLNENNFIKLKDDSKLKNVALYFANKDTNNVFEKIYFENLSTSEYLLNINKTMLKKVLSSYITNVKIKVEVTDNSFKKNINTTTFNVRLDSKQPFLKILDKSLLQVNKGSLISMKLETYDLESNIKKILINGKSNFAVVDQTDKTVSLLIPVDEEILTKKKVSIAVIDNVGNVSQLNTYFLTKNTHKSFDLENAVNTNTFLTELKHKLENGNITLSSLYAKDLQTIDEIILNISKEVELTNINKTTLNNVKNPIINNDKIGVMDCGDTVVLDNKEYPTNGDFYMANKYHKIKNPLAGKIVFIGTMNLLGDVVIVKHNNNLYSTFGLLGQINKSLKIGDDIKQGVEIGMPVYNKLFQSNLYFSVNLSNTYVKPYYFFENGFYQNNLSSILK